MAKYFNDARQWEVCNGAGNGNRLKEGGGQVDKYISLKIGQKRAG